MHPKQRYFAAAIILALLAASCAAAGERYSLQVSKLGDRSFARQLDGQTVAGDIYAFVSPETEIEKVEFYLDGSPGSGAPVSMENLAPFDLAGGAGYATPYDTRRLRDGRHTLTAVITLAGGDAITSRAAFTVNNTTPANQAIYWGAFVEGVPWDMDKLAEWESAVGKGPAIVHFWQTWSERGALAPFPRPLLQRVRDYGSIPMVSWLPEDPTKDAEQPDFQLADILDGRYDDYLRDWAADARNWGRPLFLRFGHEMNGFWFPWGEDANGNSRGEYVRAWRHVHDIFRSAGASNVTWVWCPNIDWSGSGWPTMQSVYPGDAYVDWTCLDGFNWGADRGGWKRFEEIFRWSYENIRSFAPDKPMLLGEFGSSEEGGSKAEWIAQTLTTDIPHGFPGLKAVVWYDRSADQDWRIGTSESSLEAFKAAIRSPYYSANVYGDISASPVPPLK